MQESHSQQKTTIKKVVVPAETDKYHFAYY